MRIEDQMLSGYIADPLQSYKPGQINRCIPFWNMQMMQDINASTETVYPVKNSNSMNKKLEAAKKWLQNRKDLQNS